MRGARGLAVRRDRRRRRGGACAHNPRARPHPACHARGGSLSHAEVNARTLPRKRRVLPQTQATVLPPRRQVRTIGVLSTQPAELLTQAGCTTLADDFNDARLWTALGVPEDKPVS
eukprot:5104829-Prymnesium_polylepis.1